MISIPDTNAKGWPLYVLMDMDTYEVLRSEYKEDDEAEADNQTLKRLLKKRNWQWVINDPSKVKNG